MFPLGLLCMHMIMWVSVCVGVLSVYKELEELSRGATLENIYRK